MSNPGPHLLGAKPRPHDPRDFRADAHRRITPPTAKRWANKEKVLDQGDTGHCVGFAGAQFSNVLPVDLQEHASDGHAIYYDCKLIDGEPGQENGSDLRSLAKALRQRGRISTYAFADTVEDAALWILNKGPVIVGSVWTEQMFEPSATGFVSPKGQIAGGHAYLLTGYSKSRGFRGLNSWNDHWGLGGYFRITLANLRRLQDLDWMDLLCAEEIGAP